VKVWQTSNLRQLRLGKEKKIEEDRRRNHRAKNIMACSIPQGSHHNNNNNNNNQQVSTATTAVTDYQCGALYMAICSELTVSGCILCQ